MKIEIENLQFSFGAHRVLALDSVKFDSGKIYGIVGKNGVGKTTFFKVLTNIITNYSGTCLYDGQNVKLEPAVLGKVGITLDDMELYKNYSGRFNLRYFGGLRGGFDEDKALELARDLEIADALDKKVSHYSLGMAKKLILLISLMNDAEVLIFDEPFRGIDGRSVAWFHDYLRQLKAQGKLILLSSHVQEDIDALCDEVYVLNEGKFSAPFDLTAEQQVLAYQVLVDNSQALAEILAARGMAAQVNQHSVKFDSTQAQFQDIFKEAASRAIIFDEIKKESKFAELIK